MNRITIILLIMLIGGCAMRRLPRDGSRTASLNPATTHFDIECTSTDQEALVTVMRGRFRQDASPPESDTSRKVVGNLTLDRGAHALAPTTQSFAISSPFIGEVTSTSPGTVAIAATPATSPSPVRSLTIRTGIGNSEVHIGVQPRIAFTCQISRFSDNVVTRHFPACHGAGTVTSGWYIDGKLIQHDPRCAQQIASCTHRTDRSSVWQIWNKANARLLATSRCATINRLPTCQRIGNTSQTGWFVEGRLIAADALCHLKGIACDAQGQQREGWYTFERMPGSFLSSNSDCSQMMSF